MEDAHSFVVDFDSIRGQGFFAVFDGHAGKHAAEWCGSHFHEVCSTASYFFPSFSDMLFSIFWQLFTHHPLHLSPISSTKLSTMLMKAYLDYARNRRVKFIQDAQPSPPFFVWKIQRVINLLFRLPHHPRPSRLSQVTTSRPKNLWPTVQMKVVQKA